MKTLPKALASGALCALLLTATAGADEIVRLAPNFGIVGGKSLKSFHGQPVVLVIAASPQSKAFRKEIRSLGRDYQGFAARNTIFVAAFTQSSGGVIESNIPFATATNGPAVAANYGAVEPLSVAVIGIDGNLDLKSHNFTAGYRVRDTILNNYQLQASERPDNMGALTTGTAH